MKQNVRLTLLITTMFALAWYQGLLFVPILFCLYFLPALAAGWREHHHADAICLLNLLAGWTVVGWVAAFVWAFVDQAQPFGAKQPAMTHHG